MVFRPCGDAGGIRSARATIHTFFASRWNLTMKKTDLEKAKALKTVGKMKREGVPGRFGLSADTVLDRRAQRKQDQAQGLVSFPVKLKQEVISAIRERATQQQVSTNDIIGQLLEDALKR